MTKATLIIGPVQRGAQGTQCAVCSLRRQGCCALYGTETRRYEECSAGSARLTTLLTLLDQFCDSRPRGLSSAEAEQLFTAYRGLRTSLEALGVVKHDLA